MMGKALSGELSCSLTCLVKSGCIFVICKRMLCKCLYIHVMDGLLDILRPITSISVIAEKLECHNEKLCAVGNISASSGSRTQDR